MTDRLTIEDMQILAADLHARCTPIEGCASRQAALFLSRDDIAGLDAIARFLALVSPFRSQIADLVIGKQFKKGRAA